MCQMTRTFPIWNIKLIFRNRVLINTSPPSVDLARAEAVHCAPRLITVPSLLWQNLSVQILVSPSQSWWPHFSCQWLVRGGHVTQSCQWKEILPIFWVRFLFLKRTWDDILHGALPRVLSWTKPVWGQANGWVGRWESEGVWAPELSSLEAPSSASSHTR